MVGKLILLRHGETEKNIGNIQHDRDDPEKLNVKGRAQMEATADYLKSFYQPSLLFSSTESRAIESGQIISDKLKMAVKQIRGLEERDWGEFAGKPWSEIKPILESMDLEKRYLYVPPKGESWKQSEERLVKSVKKLINAYFDQTIVVVSHGGAIRILMPFLLGLPKEETFKHDPDNASLTVFGIDSDGKLSKEVVNGTDHLPPELKSVGADK